MWYASKIDGQEQKFYAFWMPRFIGFTYTYWIWILYDYRVWQELVLFKISTSLVWKLATPSLYALVWNKMYLWNTTRFWNTLKTLSESQWPHFSNLEQVFSFVWSIWIWTTKYEFEMNESYEIESRSDSVAIIIK